MNENSLIFSLAHVSRFTSTLTTAAAAMMKTMIVVILQLFPKP